MREIPPIGTAVSFKGDSHIYIIDHGPVEACHPGCILHDGNHFEEAHLWVRKETRMWKPLTELNYIFDQPHHVGRRA